MAEQDGTELRPGQSDHLFIASLERLTAFLRQAGAPLDNNIFERALKSVVLHRKNALFYSTLHGAEVGDLFMSLIHTCELIGRQSVRLPHGVAAASRGVGSNPSAWMPWNYAETLTQVVI